MEDDQNAKVVGIAEDVFVELHHVLLVATKEIDLDASDADALHPCHFGTAFTALVHLAEG